MQNSESAALKGSAGVAPVESQPNDPPEPVVPTLPVAVSEHASHGIAEMPPLVFVIKRAMSGVVVAATLMAVAYGFGMATDTLVLTLAVGSLLLARYFLPGEKMFVRREEIVADALLLLLGWFALLAVLLAAAGLAGWLGRAPPAMYLAWAAAAPLSLLVAHGALRTLAVRACKANRNRTVVIVGVNPMARALATAIEKEPLSRKRVGGFFDDRPPHRVNMIGDRILGSLDEVAAYVKEHAVDSVYVTLSWSAQPRVDKLVDELKDSTASIYFVTDVSNYGLFEPRFFCKGGVPGISICHSPADGPEVLVKRTLDVCVAAAAIAVLSPLLLLIAAAVKLTSPGPVIFKQTRYGLDGKEITVFKFRTMRVTENGPLIKQVTKDDDRITPVGGFLRRTSLDELPQLFNVLLGNMSLVGPRPHAKVHNEVYRRLIKGYMIRHKAVPGITGLAQVNGYRGETETVEKMAARVAYDLHYIRNWSLWLDLKIIVKTFVVVLKRTNAY